MAGDASGFVSWVKANYDKIVAFLILMGLIGSLSYLAVHVGMIPDIKRRFEQEIKRYVPKHEKADAVDPGPYQEGRDTIRQPFQVAYHAWSNSAFVAEARVWCVDCRRPMPMDLTNCPFCGSQQPEDPDKDERYDGDKDGMWDGWERDHGLDPFDPSDAEQDADKDDFSNIAEFRADPRTHPNDPTSYPPVEALLRVKELTADPFMLRFMGRTTLPDGSRKFQLNLREGERTFWLRLGDKQQGFEVVKYDERIEKKLLPDSDIPRRVDESVLILQRGDKTISVQIHTAVQHNEWTVTLVFDLDGTEYTLRPDQTFKLKDREYRLISVDPQKRSVVIERSHDGKQLTVHQFSGSGQ